jgi:hypothetical protein
MKSWLRVGAVWWLSVAVVVFALGARAPAARALTLYTDQLAGPAFMGLGAQFDPYDTLKPTQLNWPLITQRLDFMSPGLLRVVEPASDYFAGYDASGNPTYRWTSNHVQELLAILSYAQSRGITVVLGDWGDPLIQGDARIPAGFIGALHTTYGYTVLRYYNVMNEPNGAGPSCPFTCWTGIMKTLSAEFAKLGDQSWLQLVGPDNANTWDDTQVAQAADRSSGLETDNPLGGDSWVTDTLQSIPGLIGAYDSHRYATTWGVENGVYGDQVRARREEISNLASPAKPYFAGEVGLTARQVTPFTSRTMPVTPALRALLDPSVSTFVDSQPNIPPFSYGIWMGDMMIQAIAAGLSGASAWDLDDAMHTGGGYGNLSLKQWGFWNSLAGQNGYPASDLAPRPWYYAWSVISRAFPAGAQTLAVPATGTPGVRVAAARIPNAARFDLSIAIVNDSSTPRTISVTVPGVTTPLTLAQYSYVSGALPVDANGLPVPAQMLTAVPSAGISVQVPANALVVLTSHGFGTPAALDQGTTTLVDSVRDWRLTEAHSHGLKFDHRSPADYNYASSRIVDTGKHNQFVTYRATQIASFELKAYYPRARRILAYGSPDGTTWTPVPLASTAPAPTVGGHELLAELLPRQPLPAATNRLKIVLGPSTELAQVRIMAGRSGPACLAAALATGGSSIGAIALGAMGRSVLGRLGVPSVRGRRAWGYCVTGGGSVGVVLTRRDLVSLVLSTAAGYRLRSIGPGSSLATVERRYGHGALRDLGRGVIVTSGGGVFVTHAGRVQAVGLAAPALLANHRSLLGAVELALSP